MNSSSTSKTSGAMPSANDANENVSVVVVVVVVVLVFWPSTVLVVLVTVVLGLAPLLPSVKPSFCPLEGRLLVEGSFEALEDFFSSAPLALSGTFPFFSTASSSLPFFC